MGHTIDYLYDGSFEGFLTCVYSHYYKERAAGIYPATSYQNTLFHDSCTVSTDMVKAEKVYDAIAGKISEQDLKRIYYVFLSSLPDKDNIAFQYIRMGFKLGRGISSYHSHPIVFAAQQAAKKVSFEAHRLTGLLRFTVLTLDKDDRNGEFLYAKIKPDHDVLALLGDHFSDRFKNEPFIIHDYRRNKALYCQNEKWHIGPIDEKALPGTSIEEKEYRRLWKNYFKNIAIKERTNPMCQKRMMPVRYWDCLTEMQ
ncbi:MAG: TIGR03915 family putative DNA repair protein [Eubacteriales bacterium]|nr:TIGR03915 family putative DNA repair protein [Eubacteriales bacterium]MDD4583497.1 TIGR03915 family putative DNA repair protein [Eubacteriales bacterium]